MNTVQSIISQRRQARVIQLPSAKRHGHEIVNAESRIVIPTSEGLRFIRVESIEYCKSEGNYCRIQLISGDSVLIAKTLKWMCEKLPGRSFVRVHASYVVAEQHISLLTNELLTLESGVKVPISRGRRAQVRQRLIGNV